MKYNEMNVVQSSRLAPCSFYTATVVCQVI